MKKLLTIALCLLTTTLSACAHKVAAPQVPAEVASSTFEKLKAMAGMWEVASDKGGESDKVMYRVTSGGSAVVEVLFPHSPHEMFSVYTNPSPGSLVMTHYCLMGNQPELAASNASPAGAEFDFVSGVGINPSKDQYMGKLKISFLSDDKIRQEWIGFKDGKEGETKVFELNRVKDEPCDNCKKHNGKPCKSKSGCPVHKHEKSAAKAKTEPKAKK